MPRALPGSRKAQHYYGQGGARQARKRWEEPGFSHTPSAPLAPGTLRSLAALGSALM